VHLEKIDPLIEWMKSACGLRLVVEKLEFWKNQRWIGSFDILLA
jgi:hypothetical protein